VITQKLVGLSTGLERGHLAKLHHAAVALSGISSLAEFGRVATSQMALLLNFEIATIWRWLPEEEMLELTWSAGWTVNNIGLRITLNEGIVGRAIAELRPIQVSSYQDSQVAIPVIAAGGLGSGMGVPLIVELGASLDVLFALIVIGVLTGRLRRMFGGADLDQLQQLRD